MTDTNHIVFLHAKRNVPQEIIDLAYKNLPAGFSLELLEQGADGAEKIKRLAEADFILGYPGHMTEEEIRAAPKCKLLQLWRGRRITPGSAASISPSVTSPESPMARRRPM